MFLSIRSRLILIACLVVASVYFLFPRNVTIRDIIILPSRFDRV